MLGLFLWNIKEKYFRQFKENLRKPNKTLVDQGIEIYIKLIKLWLQVNDIEMYSTVNEEKSVVDERFIRNLNKIYDHMTRISKNA